MKPVKRSRLRLLLGAYFYRCKKYAEWLFGSTKFASKLQENKLPFTIAEHQTPLIRNLKDVELWLQLNKIKNLKIATKQIDGIIIHLVKPFLIGKRLVIQLPKRDM